MPESVDQLASRLIEDRAKILSGDIFGLNAVEPEHSRIFENLTSERNANINKMLEIQELAKTNARLLRSAIKGMHDARASVLPRPRKTQALSTYSNSGDFKELAPQTRSVEKRA